MNFRFYQLFQLLVVGLLIYAMTGPILTYADGGINAEIENFKLTFSNGMFTRSVMALGILLVLTVAVNIFAFFVSLFSNFELQKRVSILSMLVLAGYYILLLVYSLILVEGDPHVHISILIPFVCLLLNLVSFKLIRRQEAKIIAKASGFRLRD